MSTKIYNGFKLKTNDLFELHTYITELREELKPKIKEKTTEFFKNIVIHSIDYHTIHPNGKKFSPYQLAFNKFCEQQQEVKTRQVNDSFVDYSFSLCIFPFEGSFYGTFYTSQEDFATIFKNKPYFQEFHFQDQVDPSEEIPEEEWAERQRIWNEILEIEAIPALNGFEYSIVLEETYDYPDVQDVISSLPSFEKRVEDETKNEMYTKYTKDNKVTSNNVMKLFKKWKTFFESDEGQRIFNENKIRIGNTLKKAVTHEMVMGK